MHCMYNLLYMLLFIIIVPDIGSVIFLDPRPRYSEKCVFMCVRGGHPKPDPVPP